MSKLFIYIILKFIINITIYLSTDLCRSKAYSIFPYIILLHIAVLSNQ